MCIRDSTWWCGINTYFFFSFSSFFNIFFFIKGCNIFNNQSWNRRQHCPPPPQSPLPTHITQTTSSKSLTPAKPCFFRKKDDQEILQENFLNRQQNQNRTKKKNNARGHNHGVKQEERVAYLETRHHQSPHDVETEAEADDVLEHPREAGTKYRQTST